MFRADTEGYKPTITNIVEETTPDKRRQRVKPLVRIMKDNTHTHTHTQNLLSCYKKNVVMRTAIFYMAPKIFWGKRRTDNTLRQYFGFLTHSS